MKSRAKSIKVLIKANFNIELLDVLGDDYRRGWKQYLKERIQEELKGWLTDVKIKEAS